MREQLSSRRRFHLIRPARSLWLTSSRQSLTRPVAVAVVTAAAAAVVVAAVAVAKATNKMVIIFNQFFFVIPNYSYYINENRIIFQIKTSERSRKSQQRDPSNSLIYVVFFFLYLKRLPLP